MKVILYFRDVDAETKFAAAAAKFKGLNTTQKKNAKVPNREELSTETIEAATASDLKAHVLPKLNNRPFALKEEDIRIYKKTQLDPHDKKKATLERLGDHEQQLCDGATYFALEVFTTLPTDVSRTVRLDHIYPATLCLPQCRNLTKVSPFMTAAMSEDEQGLPWHALADGEELVVRGISVSCDDTATKIGNPGDPYLDVQRGKGSTYSIDLGKYEQLAKSQPDWEIDPVFGLLETTITHKKKGTGRLAVKKHKILVPAANKKARQDQKEATEQSVLFRFKLPKGTDLSRFGMALVYNNLGPNKHHCSLVRETPIGNEHPLDWIPIYQVHPQVYEPQQIDSLDGLEDKKLEAMLSLRQVQEQPETIFGALIAGQSYDVIPKLAAQFQLQDFIVQARAEPLPPDNFDDSDARGLMYCAALVLFLAHSFNEDFDEALQMLEAADYEVGNIDRSVCKTLIQAMEDADVERDLKAVNARTRSLGLDIDPFDALHDGVDILSHAMEQDRQ